MSVLPVGFGSAAGGTPAGAVERSLRFNSADSAGLNRTAGTQTSNSAWTYSVWLKRGLISTAANLYVMRAQNPGNTLSTELFFAATNDTLVYREYGPSAYTSFLQTTQVFRDPSSWYHIVLAYNPANSTTSDKVRLYVNGVRITAFSTATYPSVTNQPTAWNTSGNPQYIGSTNTNTFDGYMTEINFIDGQGNLTQNDFGETDSNTGVWKPKAYTGTYGTNGFYLPFKTASQWSGYFDGNTDYLSVPHNSSLSPTGDFTIEFWAYTGSTALQEWVTKGYGIQIYSNASNWYAALSSSNNTTYFINGSFGAHSTNTWQHIAISRQGNTYRGFVNGVATTLGTSSSAPSTGTDSLLVGTVGPGTIRYYVTGYLSNLRIVNGTAVYTGNFTPPTSQLTAITNTSLLTCQSSTFVDNSTNAFTVTATGDTRPQQFSPFTLDVTDDHSGQGNHWIPNNLDLRTTEVGADILVDSPTAYGTDTGIGGEVRGNYCVLNPIVTGNVITPLNGNLNTSLAASSNAYFSTVGTTAVSSGKWYWECTVTARDASAGQWMQFGIVATTTTYTSNALGFSGNMSNGYAYYNDGTKAGQGTATAGYGATFTNNDVIGVALDLDAGTITFYKNGVSQGQAYSGISLTTSWLPIIQMYRSTGTTQSAFINFGQRPFQKWNGSAYVANTAPSGFKALCTQNLPTPTIGATSTTQAGKYFNTVLYTGNGVNQASGGQAISGVGFQPDWLWLKSRGTANNHILTDAVRGIGVSLSTDATVAEYSTSDDVLSFNSNGFTVASDGTNIVNGLSVNYVAWNWNAGGSNQTISVGQYATSPANVPSIASTVRANTTSGFSIVTASASGTSPVTVGHGCLVNGVATAPSLIIGKVRNVASTNWYVYSSTFSAQDYLVLNSTAAKATSSNIWDIAPTSTVFTVGNPQNGWAGGNSGTKTYVFYCFAPVAGYSAFGSYTGNGAVDGTFVYTGFRPRYVLMKSSTQASPWQVFDTARDLTNVSGYVLLPNSTATDTSFFATVDILSNGFKLRYNGDPNTSAQTYIYAAFAESPFKYSLAR